jgi:hypothetical protein
MIDVEPVPRRTQRFPVSATRSRSLVDSRRCILIDFERVRCGTSETVCRFGCSSSDDDARCRLNNVLDELCLARLR